MLTGFYIWLALLANGLFVIVGYLIVAALADGDSVLECLLEVGLPAFGVWFVIMTGFMGFWTVLGLILGRI